MRLENKVAIVTGASSGLGLAIAKRYLEEGAKVVLSDRSDAPAGLELDPSRAIFVRCDVSKSAEVDALVAQAVSTFGRLDIMVNNAGIGATAGLMETSDDDWARMMSINLNGVFYGARAAAKYMKESGTRGAIINMSSILGQVGMPGAVSYCAAKGGVLQLTHASAMDLAPFGIRINAIAPGFITTGMTKDVLANQAFSDMIKANTPLGHVGEPEDIANAALYLASDEAKYVTGTALYVDGGWTAH